MTWLISDLKKLDQHTLKGSFSLSIGPLKIEGWTYHVKNGKQWVSPPSKEYIDRESGEKKYYPMIRFPEKERYYKFQEWAVGQVKDTFAPATAQSPNTDNGGQHDIPF